MDGNMNLNNFSAIDDSISKQYGTPNENSIDQALKEALSSLNRKIVVLDDDPTGVQTVHDIYVYTNWDRQSIESGFVEANPIFFILTNSRGLLAKETRQVHEEIAKNIAEISRKRKQKYIIVSRSDSTLRGHFPLETMTLRDTLERNTEIRFDAEIIIPFFKEGGRFTINNIHYVREGHTLIPVGQTEFAKDKTFGFSSSHLGEWVEEKTKGTFTKESCTYVSLEDLRSVNTKKILDQLMKVKNFNKVIVNAIDYVDLKVFFIALARAIVLGKEFILRTASAVPKILGQIPDIPFLSRSDLIKKDNRYGGLVIIGSHVNKTTQQFELLKELGDQVEFIEFNQHLVLTPGGLDSEVERAKELAEESITKGKTVIIYTRRERFDLNTDDKEQQLAVSVKISAALTSIVEKMQVRPSYILAKGGITSSDIGIKALRLKRALVKGQAKPGIPVWMTGNESKFPDLPFIIFPGNVGEKDTLKQIIEELNLR